MIKHNQESQIDTLTFDQLERYSTSNGRSSNITSKVKCQIDTLIFDQLERYSTSTGSGKKRFD